MKSWMGITVFGLWGFALAAGAQDSVASIADLAALRSESALLKERVNNLRLRLDMENLKGNTALSSVEDNDDPSGLRVLQVAGIEGRYRVTLVWPNGDSVFGTAGTKINSHLSIQSVAVDRVMLKGEHGLFNVPFQGAADLNLNHNSLNLGEIGPSGPMPVLRSH